MPSPFPGSYPLLPTGERSAHRGVIIPGSDVRLYDVVGDAQTPYRFRTAVAHPGRAVYRECLIKHQRLLRVGEVDHFALRLFLQGEEIKYPYLCQQALDKCQSLS